jgi:hypothetical protein
VSGLVDPSGPKQPYEVRPVSLVETGAVALHARRLRNLSVPTSRRFLADKLDPRRVTAFGRQPAEGIETLAASGQLPSAASAQFVHARSSGRIGRAMAVEVEAGNSGHRRGGQSKRMESGWCRSEVVTGSNPHR